MSRAAEGDAALARLRRRDELLQVLFWLEGEGFESEMTVGRIGRFLRWPASEIAGGLRELVEDGFAVTPAAEETVDEGGTLEGDPADARSGAVRLTDAGRQEGGRRFVTEFASILSRDTHHGGECHDPECECHELGPAACTNAPAGSP